jgi:hypothetical protein
MFGFGQILKIEVLDYAVIAMAIAHRCGSSDISIAMKR